MQDLLFWHLHDPDCPALIRVLPAEGLIDGAHRAFSELLGETVDLIGILWQKVDFLDLLVELTITQEGIIRDILLLLESSHDLDHHLRVVLDHILADVVLGEELHHFWGEAFDATRAVEVHLQMHLVLEILRPKFLIMILADEDGLRVDEIENGFREILIWPDFLRKVLGLYRLVVVNVDW